MCFLSASPGLGCLKLPKIVCPWGAGSGVAVFTHGGGCIVWWKSRLQSKPSRWDSWRGSLRAEGVGLAVFRDCVVPWKFPDALSWLFLSCRTTPQGAPYKRVGTYISRKVRKVGLLESPNEENFRKFWSKRWSFERWRRAILLQEPGEFFYPSGIGDLQSPEHTTSTKTQFLFEKMQLRSWILKLKTYVSATKCGRMKRL